MALAAIVLAGGRSSRMGRDKALIAVAGMTLLERVCRVAAQCSSQVVVVTPWPDRYRALPGLQSCQFVQEQSPEAQGPLVGFAQGLAQVRADWVLLLACDLPRLEGSLLQQWGQQLERVPPAAIALLPRHPKGWEPLCGFYRHRCLPDLQEFIEEGGRSFQDWLATQVIQELSLTCPQMLFNCNTPEDLTTIGLV
ncbi:molybdenum cofactor guanylyltransferase [Leptolyngbya sp. 'hensonii']|uniref:molybdenum cofactor guanylyltransferase n=1 Tax=Leptolyngbya sp. 'hensonii' TaxID=1922337 RepID=UPI00094FBB5F|nr:molybdenum cofactor guanylyltransferase [Leptolyngbya sp. 'hensonii']OLP18060.1 molybdenum cofactor guanylyltransferase [Leptolyngbya sp. 'hensonii']